MAVTDVLEDEGREATEKIEESGGEAVFWALDVSDEQQVRSVFQQIRDRFGSIDILVNNAGISGTDKPPDALAEEDWDRVLAINVKGVAFYTKYAVPYA